MQHLRPNTTLQGGKYRIDRVLGQGGFGITYLARNTVFDIDVAIKEFFMKDENDRDGSSVTMPNTTKQELFHGQMEKFKKEAKRMFAIKNEHIVGVQDLFEENGTAYYVMDYVDGENLAERLKRTGKPMTEQEVRDILPQILDALKSVHDAGIWHLDLKPANILIDKSGLVKLIDFGASKQMNVQKGGATTSTAISYTNGYAPREQMEQNYNKFGPWTDIYALGATLYNLLTNKRPPLPSDIDDDISEDKHLALPFPDGVGELKFLVLQMLKTNRLQRPQNIDAIMEAELSRKEEPVQTPKQQPASQPTADYDDEATITAESRTKEEEKTAESQPKEKYNQFLLSDSHIIGKATNRIRNIIFGSSIFRAICIIMIGVLLLKDIQNFTQYSQNRLAWYIVSVGILLLLSGIIALIAYRHAKKHTGEYTFIQKQGGKVYLPYPFPVAGVFCVILGLVLVIAPLTFFNALRYVLAFTMILWAGDQLRSLSEARHFGYINILFWIAPPLILLIGISVILKPMKNVGLPLLILGWCSLFCGVTEIVNAIKINTILKNAERKR